MIEKFMSALCGKDYKGLAGLFADDCRYFDYCPYLNGQQGYFVYGKEAVEMFFRNRFVHGHFEAASPVIDNENSATFFGAYDGPFVFARVQIEEYAENGCIQRVVVSPAQGGAV